MEKRVPLLLDYADGMCCFAQRDGCMLRIATADAVDSYKEASAAAFDAELDGLVVSDNDRADIQTVRSHGGEYEDLRLGVNDGSAGAERIGGRACGSGDDEAIAHISCQMFTSDMGVYSYHR